MDTALKRAVIVALALGLCAVARGETVPVLGNAGRFTADTQVKATKAGDAGAPSFTYRGLEVPTVADFVPGENISITTEGRTLCVDTTGVLTTVSVEASPGHPLHTEVDGSKIVISTKGGTHPVDSTLTWDATPASTDSYLGYFPEGEPLPDGSSVRPSVPFILKAPAGHWSLTYGSGASMEGWTPPDSILDLIVASDPELNSGPYTAYRFHPLQGLRFQDFEGLGSTYGLNADILGGLSVGYTLSVGGKVTGGSDAEFSGKLESDSVTATGADYASLSDRGLGFGIPGTVNGRWLMAKEDLHVLEHAYVSGRVIVGRGRQAKGPDGSLVIMSKGLDGLEGAPLPGSQVSAIYTNESGTNFSNHYAGLEQGSISTTFNFDDTVKAPALQATGSGTGLTVTNNAMVGGTLTTSGAVAANGGLVQVHAGVTNRFARLRPTSLGFTRASDGAETGMISYDSMTITYNSGGGGGGGITPRHIWQRNSSNAMVLNDGSNLSVAGRIVAGSATSTASGAYLQAPSLDVSGLIKAESSAIGFFGATPAARPTVASTALTFSNPPTQAECEALAARVEEIRVALATLGLVQ